MPYIAVSKLVGLFVDFLFLPQSMFGCQCRVCEEDSLIEHHKVVVQRFHHRLDIYCMIVRTGYMVQK